MWSQATLACPSQLLCGAGETWDLTSIGTILYHSAACRGTVLSLPLWFLLFSILNLPALCDCPFVLFASFMASVRGMSFGAVKEGLCFPNNQLPAPFKRSELLRRYLLWLLWSWLPRASNKSWPQDNANKCVLSTVDPSKGSSFQGHCSWVYFSYFAHVKSSFLWLFLQWLMFGG